MGTCHVAAASAADGEEPTGADDWSAAMSGKRNGMAIGIVLLLLWFCLLFAQPVQAAQQDILLEQSGAADLTEDVDGSIRAELESYGISMDDSRKVFKNLERKRFYDCKEWDTG